jgi:hypothetical protein
MTSELRAPPTRPQDARSFLSIPRESAGEDSRWISENAVQVAALLARNAMERSNKHDTLDEQLYNSRAACKTKTANVAMHLDKEWRARFFTQVDNLLSAEEWDEGDKPITEASFTTLLRLMLLIRAERGPGLGATSDGNVIATWTVENDRLTVECQPLDQVRWVLLRYLDGQRESAAGQTDLLRLRQVLEPYDPKRWFLYEGSKASV